MKLLTFTMLVILYSTGISGTRIIVPLVSHDLGASTVSIGIIVALYSILPLFFQ